MNDISEDFVDAGLSVAEVANIAALFGPESEIALLYRELSLGPVPGARVYIVVVKEGNISVMLIT